MEAEGGKPMWTRAELKTRAKMCLKQYYWWAFLVSLIFAIISSVGSGGSGGIGNGAEQSVGGYEAHFETGDGFSSGLVVPEGLGQAAGIAKNLPIPGSDLLRIGGIAAGIMVGVMIAVFVVSLVLGIFVIPVFEVGHNRFYMESRLMMRSAGVEKILWGFKNRYLNLVGAMFIRGLIVGLAALVSCIPMLAGAVLILLSEPLMVFGVILMLLDVPVIFFVSLWLNYAYFAVPFILAENPEMKAMEAMRLSREMTKGHKFSIFVLDLSFLGWYLLGLLACGIGMFFVTPYVQATYAELYAVLRRPYDNGRLNGFGIPEYGGPGGGYGGPGGEYDSYSGGYGGPGSGSYDSGVQGGYDPGWQNGPAYGNAPNAGYDSFGGDSSGAGNYPAPGGGYPSEGNNYSGAGYPSWQNGPADGNFSAEDSDGSSRGNHLEQE